MQEELGDYIGKLQTAADDFTEASTPLSEVDATLNEMQAQLSEAEQRAAARRFVDRFCQPGKPSVMGVEVRRRGTPIFFDEVYEYSRKKYLAE